MKRKLDAREYSDALKFYADFKLMIRNCFTFNPPGTPVNNAGQALAALFEEKWAGLPPLREVQSDNDDDDDDDSEDEDDSTSHVRVFISTLTRRVGAINALTSQLESVKSNLAALQGRKKRKKDDKKRKPSSQPKASGSKAYNGSGSSKKKGKGKVADVDEVLSFDQKKELSETIQTLEGQKLERVISIIHEGVPEIRDVRALSVERASPLTSLPSSRARKKSSSTSTSCRRPCCSSCTTPSCAPSRRRRWAPRGRAGHIAPRRTVALAGSSARAWTRRPRRSVSASLRSASGSSTRTPARRPTAAPRRRSRQIRTARAAIRTERGGGGVVVRSPFARVLLPARHPLPVKLLCIFPFFSFTALLLVSLEPAVEKLGNMCSYIAKFLSPVCDLPALNHPNQLAMLVFERLQVYNIFNCATA